MWLLIASIIIFIIILGFIVMGNSPNPNTNCDCPNRGPNGCPNGCPKSPCNRCGKPRHHCRCNKNVGCSFC